MQAPRPYQHVTAQDLARLRQKNQRLLAALEKQGGDPAATAAQINDRAREIRAIDEELALRQQNPASEPAYPSLWKPIHFASLAVIGVGMIILVLILTVF